jgi:glycosyltransferase involved in cell wall biosynthesis
MELTSVVVVPARDEQETIAACLRALAAQTIGLQRFETIVVLDGCRDATAEVVASSAATSGLTLTTLIGAGQGAGAARRLGMDAAAERLFECGRPDGLIVCTDADSRPAADWIERQLAHARDGARAIAGFIELDPLECRGLPEPVLRRRDRDAATRLRHVRVREPEAGHHHFAGASLAVTAAVYRSIGGLEPLEALEDAAFADRLTDHRIPIHRPLDVRVTTSARARGRARRGLSLDLEVSTWSDRRRYRAGDFRLECLAAAKGAADTSVSVIVPAKECADTIAGIVRDTVGPLATAGLVDELVVIDADSRDGTAAMAAAAGATVLQQDAVLSEFGPALGKGDAMWRALSATSGDVVCFLDGDTADPHPDHLLGLLGPILTDGRLMLVKGTFERALQTGGRSLAHEGGRVTELMARPLINLHEPRLAGFAQPLAGEFAARRPLLESLPFPVGYGVEIALLIDALRSEGLDALAECDLGRRQNRHQPLRVLGEMAYAVLAAVERRLGDDRTTVIGGNYLRPWEDGAVVSVPVAERRPLLTLESARRHRTPVASC